MTDNTDPLAIIKVTFDDLPEEFKSKLYIFMGAGLTCLILTNIILIHKILDFYYSKFKFFNRRSSYYEAV